MFALLTLSSQFPHAPERLTSSLRSACVLPLRGAYGEGKRDPLLQGTTYNNGYMPHLQETNQRTKTIYEQTSRGSPRSAVLAYAIYPNGPLVNHVKCHHSPLSQKAILLGSCGPGARSQRGPSQRLIGCCPKKGHCGRGPVQRRQAQCGRDYRKPRHQQGDALQLLRVYATSVQF